MEPRVAVIMPCFNDGAWIAEAVASVAGDAGLRPEQIELVIVDDASTDPATRDVLAQLESQGERVIRHGRNQGPSRARNTGLAETTAPYIYPLDADDIAEPGILIPMALKLDAHPEVGVCFGDFVELQPNGRFLRAVPERLDPFRIAYTNELPGTALFRRWALEQTGGWFDPHPTLRGYEDWNLWMTFVEQGLGGVHAGFGVPIFRYRLHEGRVNAAARDRHRQLYRRMRELHPDLFGNLAEHRWASDLGTSRKLLYPIVYGGRPRLQYERSVRRLLNRAGLWRLRR